MAWSLSAQAAPAVTFEKVTINGYDVYLVNTHTGNGVALTTNVQRGSWHDEPIHYAGLTHLWEHVIHGGSQRFPGHTTLAEMNNRLGTEANAYTSSDRTFFHWYLHPNGLPLAIQMMGAMVSAPEWNPTTFAMEKSTVKNEALEYQQTDERAMESMMFIHLLPPDHPLRMYNIGTQAQLDAMTLVDLKRLFYANYAPGNLQIIVAGNFDASPGVAPPLDRKSILEALRENFIPPNAAADPDISTPLPPPGKAIRIPDLPASDHSRYLEIGSRGEERSILLRYAIPPEAARDPGALEIFLDLLSLPNRGGLLDLLIRKGWITSGDTSLRTVKTLRFGTLYFALTAEGARHRMEILEIIQSTLGKLAEEGISDELLHFLKERNINSYEATTLPADAAAERMAKWIDQGGPALEAVAFDFRAIFGPVRTEQIRELAAQAFSANRMIGAYLGPEVVGGPIDPLFNRPVHQIESRELLSRWTQAFQSPHAVAGIEFLPSALRIEAVPITLALAPRDRPAARPRLVPLGEGNLVAVEEDHRSVRGGLSARIAFAGNDGNEKLTRSLWVDAFITRNQASFDYLAAMGAPIKLRTNGGSVLLTSSGNAQGALSAAHWVWSALAQFQPTEEELRQSSLVVAKNLRNEFDDGFTATNAKLAAFRVENLNSRPATEVLASLETLNLARISAGGEDLSRRLFERGNLTLALSGDYDEESAAEVVRGVSRLTPGRLSAEEAGALQAARPISENGAFFRPLGPSKSDDAFGWARIFDGPEYLSAEEAALSILTDALRSSIFTKNRVEQELGYIHSATLFPSTRGSRVMFFGQTEGSGRVPRIAEGWDEVLRQVQAGTLSPDGFAGTKEGMLRARTLQPKTPGDRVAQLFSDLYDTGNPNASEIVNEQMSAASAEEIYAVGRRYLVDAPHLDILVGKAFPNRCTELLLPKKKPY